MASIVLVHGIAQESSDARQLETKWIPALADGLRAAGESDLATDLTADPALRPRMAFYGDLFVRPGTQGGGSADLDAQQVEMADALAAVWLAAAADRASDPRDRAEAARALYAFTPEARAGAAGIVAVAGRPTINALMRLRWFAPYGFDFVQHFVWQALSQVTGYLTDDALRESAQRRVIDLIGPDTDIVVAHSLGSVVAYEALHRQDHPVALLTLGSPLALDTVIYPRLRPQPTTVPRCVRDWTNLSDPDDIVAARPDLGPWFPPYPGHSVVPVTPPEPVDNGAKPHDAGHYLFKAQTGRAVVAALR